MRTIEDHEKAAEQEHVKIEARLEAAKRLTPLGLDIYEHFMHFGSIHVKTEELPAVRKALGCKLKLVQKWADTPYLVKHRLEAEKYPGLDIYYLKPIPPGAKCHIETRRIFQVESTLVCSI